MELEIKDTKYEQGVTKEGLEYILIPDPKSYSVSFTANIRVGANLDLIGGEAHFLEHCVFKSSSRAKYNVKQKEIEYRGSIHNGGTSYDFTRYYITLPYTELKYGFTFLEDTLVNALFNEKEVEAERRVILDEINKDLNDPWVLAYHTVKNNYLKINTANSGNILGTAESLNLIGKKELLKTYSKYGPKNIVLAVSGKFKKREVERYIKDYSEKMSLNKDSKKLTFLNSEFREPGKIVLKSSKLSNNPIVSLSTKVKGRSGTSLREDITSALFQRMLAKGESSVLFKELRDKTGYLYSYGLDNLIYENFSLVSLNYECSSEKFYEILDSISKVIKKVKLKGFSEKQLEHWKTFNLNRNLIANDTHTSIGRGMLWDYFYSKKIHTTKEKIDVLMSIKLDEINSELKAIELKNFEVAVVGNIKGVEPKKINQYFN
ncbi:insulinase family protein [bacterium]|nr:insulinase family protein [bacterium]